MFVLALNIKKKSNVEQFFLLKKKSKIYILLVSVANLETSGELGVETGAAAMMCERRRGFFGESVSERRRLPGLLQTQSVVNRRNPSELTNFNDCDVCVCERTRWCWRAADADCATLSTGESRDAAWCGAVQTTLTNQWTPA